MKLLGVVSLFCLALDSTRGHFTNTQVRIEESGYTGIVLAIHPSVEQNEGLIKAIQDTWTDASHDLYVATKGNAYFKEIVILLPRTWNGIESASINGISSYDKADIIIAPPNLSHRNKPYTVQYEGCGRPGIRSHFTPEYFLNDQYIESYGPRGKSAVHEWAHYRWGIFKETSNVNQFYWDPEFGTQDGPQAVRCPRDLSGDIKNTDSLSEQDICSLADLDPDTASYPNYCVFEPHKNQSNINTSLMCYPGLDAVTAFCHDYFEGDQDTQNAHNIYAPNDQNRLCDLKSTWAVIQESSDYQIWTDSQKVSLPSTTPTFNIIQSPLLRFLLILDDSANMNERKMDALQKSAYQFITVSAPVGSALGIVKFSSTATILSEMTVINSTATRENLARTLNNMNGARSCCISCGIEEGIKVLENYSDAAGAHMVIVTGDQGGDVEKVYSDVLSKGIVVDSVFIDTIANGILRELSDESGGVWYHSSTTADLQESFNQIAACDSTEDNCYQVHKKNFTLAKEESFTTTVYIDSTIGRDTVFFFTWSQGLASPLIEVTSPEGCIYTNDPSVTQSLCESGNPAHSINADFKVVKFKITGNASVGQWKYKVHSSNNTSNEITSFVTSLSSQDVGETITTESGIEQTTVNNISAIVIYVKVTQGYTPIVGVTVVANVGRPNGGSEISIPLYDNGVGSDIYQGDGIYSRYFTEFSGKGRYSVKIIASNHQDSTIRLQYDEKVTRTGHGTGKAQMKSDAGIRAATVDDFERVMSSGAFTYDGDYGDSSIPQNDIFPPGKINDLRVKQMDLQDYTKGLELQFTATGDNLDVGTASRYELRYTYGDPIALMKECTACYEVWESDLSHGSLTPQSSGELEKIGVKISNLPHNKKDLWVAFEVKAVDGSDNYGDSSNIAIIDFFIEPLAVLDSDNATTTKPQPSTDASSCPPTTSPICPVYHEDIKLLKITAISLAVIAGIFMSATVILSIWLHKVSKLLKDRNRSHVRGVENVYELDELKSTEKHQFFDETLDGGFRGSSVMKKPVNIPRAVSVYSVDWPY